MGGRKSTKGKYNKEYIAGHGNDWHIHPHEQGIHFKFKHMKKIDVKKRGKGGNWEWRTASDVIAEMNREYPPNFHNNNDKKACVAWLHKNCAESKSCAAP
jgi:hypothetical protein